MHEFNIDKYDKNILQFLKKYLFNKYIEYHELIFDFINYWKTNKNSISHICDELKHDKYKNLPMYIKNYFKNINKEIIKLKNKKQPLDNVLQQIDDKNVFLANLQEELLLCIDNYLGISTNDNCDY